MTTILRPWICDGTPKNGQDYSCGLGSHDPVEVFTDICPICCLPREAGKSVFTGVDVTVMGRNKMNKTAFYEPPKNIFSLFHLLFKDKGIGVSWRFLVLGTILGVILTNLSMIIFSPKILGTGAIKGASRNDFLVGLVSGEMGDFISQGEKVFFEVSPLKQMGADAFRLGNWQGAIALYGEYIEENDDDYEAQIYQQNAVARLRGNPITFAMMVKGEREDNVNLLAGVVRYQREFNQQHENDHSQRLLEIVMVNYQGSDIEGLSQNILNANDIIGILDYGLDEDSYKAVSIYKNQGLEIISPLNLQWNQKEKKLQVIEQKNRETVYLTMATEALLSYANSLNSPPNVILFYDSKDDYSTKFKSTMVKRLPIWKGNLVVEVDVSQNKAPEKVLQTVTGANTIVMALGENRLPEAIKIAKENNYFLPILVSHNLFSTNTLTQGAEAVDQWVMALPWGFSSDIFVDKAAIGGWNEELVYDALKGVLNARCEADNDPCGIAFNPHRGNLNKLLQEGIKLSNNKNYQDDLLKIPLVQVVPDFEGLSETGYEFEIKTIENAQ